MTSNNGGVLIVGGGPTGLVLACELARRGVFARVIDKAPEFFDGSRGKGIHPRTLETFDDIGIIERVVDAGEPQPPMRLYNRGNAMGVLYLTGGELVPDLPYPTMYLVAQSRTEQILRDRLAELGGRSVELGRELVDLRHSEDSVTAVILNVVSGDIEEASFAYLVGADGGRSAVRKLLGLQFDGSVSMTQSYIIGDLEIDGLEPGYRYAWADTANHTFAQATPMKGSKLWQFGGNVFLDAPGYTETASLHLFQRMLDERTGMTLRAHSPVWISDFAYNTRMVDHYRRGRVFVAGDAAHVHSPVSGEGLNAGVQDSYNLGWKLALVVRGHASDDLLDSYEHERAPVARKILSSSSQAHMALFSTKPVVALLRRFVVLPALRLRAVGRAVMRRFSGLTVNYRDSALSRDEAGRRGRVRAGDRAPDGRCVELATGEPVRIFDVLRTSHFVVICFGTPPAGVAAEISELAGHVEVCQIVRRGSGNLCRVIVDRTGRTFRRYGVRRSMVYVVRPDGYVAYRGRPALGAIRSAPVPFVGGHPVDLVTGSG